jgi:hypothetical protein
MSRTTRLTCWNRGGASGMCVLPYFARDRPHRVLHCRLPGSCQLDDWVGLFIGVDDVNAADERMAAAGVSFVTGVGGMFRYAPPFDAL